MSLTLRSPFILLFFLPFLEDQAPLIYFLQNGDDYLIWELSSNLRISISTACSLSMRTMGWSLKLWSYRWWVWICTWHAGKKPISTLNIHIFIVLSVDRFIVDYIFISLLKVETTHAWIWLIYHLTIRSILCHFSYKQFHHHLFHIIKNSHTSMSCQSISSL